MSGVKVILLQAIYYSKIITTSLEKEMRVLGKRT
jgi:hypothetical protein